MSRRLTVHRKVPTDYGSLHVHVEFDDGGRACGAWVSTPGKFENKEIDGLIKLIAAAFDETLRIGL